MAVGAKESRASQRPVLASVVGTSLVSHTPAGGSGCAENRLPYGYRCFKGRGFESAGLTTRRSRDKAMKYTTGYIEKSADTGVDA